MGGRGWSVADVRRFLARSAVEVAPELLGWKLVRRVGVEGRRGRTVRLVGRIVEVEAYGGHEDRGSHGFGGRATARNASMFGRAGLAYVYFTYGMHHCFNVVVGEAGVAEAVLVRAVEPVEGAESMRALRASASGREASAIGDRALCSGPAKLCQAMSIGKGLDGVDLLRRGSELRIEPGEAVGAREVERGPRIGLGERAGSWREAMMRWWLAGNGHVSR